jgi:1L-myo-inositol 1-phosphate cytidylyltransferase / CDP-L-myo-inositol myo-inositolphosphotransferase
VCDQAFVETAERALAAGERTWDAVKRRWMKEGGRLDAVDLSGSVWVDVGTPEDVRRAEELIVRRAGAGPSDGPVSRWINRPLSRRLSLPLARSGVSPTAVTLAGFVLTLLAAAVVALGALWPLALVLGGLLVQLSLVVDGCDGELARATHRTSRSGAFLDSLLDRLGDIALLLALAVAAGLDTRGWVALVAALAPVLLVPYVKAAYEARMGAAFPPSRWMLGRDSRLFLIAVGAVVMQPLVTLVVIAAVSTLEAAVRIRRGVAAAARS